MAIIKGSIIYSTVLEVIWQASVPCSLYLSVHGLCVNSLDFFLTSDADTSGSLRRTAVGLYASIAVLKANNKNLCVVVFDDACRTEHQELQNQFRRWKKLTYPDLSNVFILFASTPDKEALGYDTFGLNSLFTGCLLKHLCDPISLELICMRVIGEVSRISEGRQVPVIESHNVDHDIYLDPSSDTLPMDGSIVSIVGSHLFQKHHHHENVNSAVPPIWKHIYTESTG